jgi:hypothetical protein
MKDKVSHPHVGNTKYEKNSLLSLLECAPAPLQECNMCPIKFKQEKWGQPTEFRYLRIGSSGTVAREAFFRISQNLEFTDQIWTQSSK